jgi:hypothetical protein
LYLLSVPVQVQREDGDSSADKERPLPFTATHCHFAQRGKDGRALCFFCLAFLLPLLSFFLSFFCFLSCHQPATKNSGGRLLGFVAQYILMVTGIRTR